MSSTIAVNRRTVYLSNIPFRLTNSDLHQLLQKYGKIARVTVMKDKVTRRSKGVAFVLFSEEQSAKKCVEALDNTLIDDRTVKCSIARENGRTNEFVKRREYADKSRCYECGEEGHLSFSCPKNSLGNREVTKKKKRSGKRKERKQSSEQTTESDYEEDTESLSAAIRFQQQKFEEENLKRGLSMVDYSHSAKRLKIKQSTYFSDEEEESFD